MYPIFTRLILVSLIIMACKKPKGPFSSQSPSFLAATSQKDSSVNTASDEVTDTNHTPVSQAPNEVKSSDDMSTDQAINNDLEKNNMDILHAPPEAGNEAKETDGHPIAGDPSSVSTAPPTQDKQALEQSIVELNTAVSQDLINLEKDPNFLAKPTDIESCNMQRDIIEPLMNNTLAELEEQLADIQQLNQILVAKVQEADLNQEKLGTIVLKTDHGISLWEAKVLLQLEKILKNKIEVTKKEEILKKCIHK